MRVVYFLIVFFTFTHVKGQHLIFYTPEKLRQLPSSETYNIIQDKKGVIWFSTEAGVCKYNGNDLKIYSSKNGLKEGACYGICKNSKGDLLFGTSKNRLLTYTNDSLIELPFSKAFAKKSAPNGLINNMSLENDSLLFIYLPSMTYSINLFKKNIEEVIPEKNNYDLLFLKTNNLLVPVQSHIPVKNFNSVRKRNSIVVAIKENDKIREFEVPITKKEENFHRYRYYTARTKKGEFVLAFNSTIVKIKTDFSIEILDIQSGIISTYIDKEGDLWVGTMKKGVLLFKNSNLHTSAIRSLNGVSVSGVLEDEEGGIWCTTLEKGIFYCKSKYVISYDNVEGLNHKSDFLKAIDNQLYVFAESGLIVKSNNEKIQKIEMNLNPTFFITDLIKNQQGWVISGNNFITQVDEKFKPIGLVRDINYSWMPTGANQLVKISENKCLGIQYSGIKKIEGLKQVKVVNIPLAGKCIFYNKEFGLLIGCGDGLYKVDTGSLVAKEPALLTGSVTKILENKEDIVVTTKDSGVFRINKGIVTKIRDLPTNRFFDGVEDYQHIIWLASDVGVISIKPFSNKYTIYNTLNGLNSNEILHIATDNNSVYVTSSEGLVSFPINTSLISNYLPRAYVDSIYVNQAYTPLNNNSLNLEYSQNNIEFKLTSTSYKRDNSSPLFYFTLISEDRDEIHQKTENERIYLTGLEPGNYNLYVYTGNNNGKHSSIPLQINIHIKSPFWKTPTFIISVMLLFIGIVFLIIKLVVERIKRKEEEKTRINKLLAEYHMSALRSQMNPHFIFNCINSIQRYVLVNQPQEAYDYLSKFSKLIRLVLNYSEENFISLWQEIEIIELYLELEKKRFENRFSYSISVLNEIDQHEIQVPVLIMQPYIENAIWHGIMNLNKEISGHINITISVNEEILTIIIEDNGVGRDKAFILSKKTHKSKANNINNLRAEILAAMTDADKSSVVIEDIKQNDAVIGTRVILKIPQNIDKSYE